MMGDFRNWGVFEEEKKLRFRCDEVVPESNDVFFRAVSIRASSEIIFKWLCQMRVAPYSYDLVDNLGRRSPRVLSPGLTELEVGQKFMFIFDLVHFVKEKEVTICVPEGRVFGACAITYLIKPGEGDNRLIVKFALRYPGHVIGWFMRRLLPFGDLVMCRKQLLTFKKLAEDMQLKENTEHGKEN